LRAQLAWWLLLGAGLLGQTTLFSEFLSDSWRPDMTRSLVLWVALTGSPRGGPALAACAGAALAAASGAPLGFGAGARLLLYALARPFRGIFFDDHPLLLSPLGATCALVDGLGVWAMSWISLAEPLSFSAIRSVLWHQSLAEGLCLPLFFLFFEILTGRRPLRDLARKPA
jgi:hypothetical protein